MNQITQQAIESTPIKETVQLIINNTPWYIDPHWLMLIVTIGAIISAFIGVNNQINNSRDIAKKTKALEVLMNLEKNKMHERGLAVIRKYLKMKGTKSINRLAEIKHDDTELEKMSEAKRKKYLEEWTGIFEDYNNLSTLLNYYEYIAISIKRNIMCEETIRNASFSTICYIYENTCALISAIKISRKKDTLYGEYEWLYKRWNQKGVGYDGPLPKMDK